MIDSVKTYTKYDISIHTRLSTVRGNMTDGILGQKSKMGDYVRSAATLELEMNELTCIGS